MSEILSKCEVETAGETVEYAVARHDDGTYTCAGTLYGALVEQHYGASVASLSAALPGLPPGLWMAALRAEARA